ncbi:hypothetical protein [Ralstonia syzygii]|uniref:hypothetical protein n=1 Tax=Ralstonia syzygii TaxID=28097 RepID=UPI0018D1D137|nr:hypothetical protein [Ralstonia syzygii]
MTNHSPARNEDLRHFDTSGLDRSELRDAQQQGRRLYWIAQLGSRWIGSLTNAPQRGTYNNVGKRIA